MTDTLNDLTGCIYCDGKISSKTSRCLKCNTHFSYIETCQLIATIKSDDFDSLKQLISEENFKLEDYKTIINAALSYNAINILAYLAENKFKKYHFLFLRCCARENCLICFKKIIENNLDWCSDKKLKDFSYVVFIAMQNNSIEILEFIDNLPLNFAKLNFYLLNLIYPIIEDNGCGDRGERY